MPLICHREPLRESLLGSPDELPDGLVQTDLHLPAAEDGGDLDGDDHRVELPD